MSYAQRIIDHGLACNELSQGCLGFKGECDEIVRHSYPFPNMDLMEQVFHDGAERTAPWRALKDVWDAAEAEGLGCQFEQSLAYLAENDVPDDVRRIFQEHADAILDLDHAQYLGDKDTQLREKAAGLIAEGAALAAEYSASGNIMYASQTDIRDHHDLRLVNRPMIASFSAEFRIDDFPGQNLASVAKRWMQAGIAAGYGSCMFRRMYCDASPVADKFVVLSGPIREMEAALLEADFSQLEDTDLHFHEAPEWPDYISMFEPEPYVCLVDRQGTVRLCDGLLRNRIGYGDLFRMDIQVNAALFDAFARSYDASG